MIEEHRFGHFELRPGQRCLLANGRPVPLGGRALDLLLPPTAARVAYSVAGLNERGARPGALQA